MAGNSMQTLLGALVGRTGFGASTIESTLRDSIIYTRGPIIQGLKKMEDGGPFPSTAVEGGMCGSHSSYPMYTYSTDTGVIYN